jgi:hypothetical protein
VTATSCAVAPAKVLLAKPKNKGKVKKRRVKLKWNRADCAEKYKVIVRKGSKKGKTVFRNKVKFETETKTEKLKKGQRYFWRVRGRNDVGWGDWSDWWKFKIRR